MLDYKNTPKLLIKKPLVYIAISIIIGNITYLLLNNSLVGAIIFITPIIFLCFHIIDKKFFIVLIAFSLLSCLSSHFYYSINENKNGIYTVKIIEISKDEVIGVLRERKVYVNELPNNIEVGEKIVFKGKFKKYLDIEEGIVGYVFIKKQIGTKKSYNYYTNKISEDYFNKMKNILDENKSAFLTALVFGNKSFLSYSQKNNLSNLGVIHLICISGFHVSLLFMYINKVFNKKLSIIICLIYIILIGCPISAIRAFIMTFLMVTSKNIFKSYDSLSALCLACIILIFYKPYMLYESGFVLSFLATLGIILFNKIFNKAFYMFPNYINNFLSLTLSAQVFIYPYMILKFNKFSMNFLLGGFLLTPIISFILPIGFLTIILLLTIKTVGLLYIPLNILFLVLNGILIFLNRVSLENIFIHEFFGVFYIIIFVSMYMSYKGFKRFDIIIYSMIPVIVLFTFYLNITML